MRSLEVILLSGCLILGGSLLRAESEEPASSKTGVPEANKTLARLSQLVSGTWVNENPKFVVEFRYEWAFGGKAIRGLGVIDKSGMHPTPAEVLLGWDPVNQTVYYLDCHGGNTVYKGTVKLDGDDLVFEFTTLIGTPATWREVLKLPDKDTMQFTIYSQKDGKWVPAVHQTSRRVRPKTDTGQLVTEGIIDAPLHDVWAAFTTKEGQESWNVAHAEIELKIGGKMRTHYDPKGRIGDANTIENTILCFEPNRMLAIQVANPPERFPFKSAIKKMWTVLYFDDAGPSRTRLTLVGTGYGDDDESKKLREFFGKGNAFTLKKLQDRFVRQGQKPR
jgi:uncharacterized protein YndB with AHSA1/START domain